MKRDEIVRILRERQKDLAERYHVVYLSLFGPVARGENRSGGKLGILVKFARPTGTFHFVDLKKYLENILGCTVDIGKPQALKPEVKLKILQEAVRVL